MEQQEGLRERKKRRTRQAISDAAIGLFLDAGYGQTSLSEIAEAAEVSRRTLFSYFPSKESLVLHRIADHEGESARVVLGRPAHLTPLAALKEHFLDGLRRCDPVTGLCADRQVVAVHQLIIRNPALANGLQAVHRRGADALAAALMRSSHNTAVELLTARLAAGQIMSTQQLLAEDNLRHLTEGQSTDARFPVAVAAAEHGFALLGGGLAAHL
jgi:AcrR family transcriptional regulator